MTKTIHFRKLENCYATAQVNRYYDPVLRIDEGTAELTIPVREEFFHAGGAVHGSVYFKALDDAAFFAANSLIMDVFVLTASFTLYFTRPITTGSIHARGKVVNHSSRLIIAEAVLYDDHEAQIARGSGSFMPSSIKLTPEIGYK